MTRATLITYRKSDEGLPEITTVAQAVLFLSERGVGDKEIAYAFGISISHLRVNRSTERKKRAKLGGTPAPAPAAPARRVLDPPPPPPEATQFSEAEHAEMDALIDNIAAYLQRDDDAFLAILQAEPDHEKHTAMIGNRTPHFGPPWWRI
jgi:hypothetical protein